MQIFECQQGSDEWNALKLGVVSASNFSKVLNARSGRGLYLRKLAGERLSGVTQIGYSNGNMEAGIELEIEAREYYEMVNCLDVQQVGFVKKEEWVGCSPDGLVGEDGLIEIKCVIPSTHIETILKGKMPTTYRPQAQGQLYVTGRKWVDFISYCPVIKSKPYYCVRVLRDEEYIKELAIQTIIFVNELKGMIDKLTRNDF